MKHRILSSIILTLAIATNALATVTYSAKWKKAEVVIEGPKSAGEIKVEARVSEEGFLDLKVQSNYGEYHLENEILSPLIESLTIHRYSENSDFSKDLFYVCLLYGEKGRSNRGSDEKPNYHWQYNKVVYSFRPGKSDKKLFKNTEPYWVPSDCSPGSFI